MPATAFAQRRIARLASLPAVHRAFHWLHLHQPQLRQWQLEFVRIPAPTFHESARADWFLDRFHQLGLTNIHLDPAGNALAELSPRTLAPTPWPLNPSVPSAPPPCLLLSAHLDTVFPLNTDVTPREDPDSPRIYAPGICDNAAGLSGLLAIAAALRYANIEPPVPILFAANVGEEGQGDLRGMRQLFSQPPYKHRIAAAIALEGSGNSAVVTRALGSLRFRVTLTGPGGHSWSDNDNPNPILVLSQALTLLSERIPNTSLTSRTTFNVGCITGGTSINSIPESASALLEIRSTHPERLREAEAEMHSTIQRVVSSFSQQHTTKGNLKTTMEAIGDRPAAALPDDSPILHTLRAVDRHLTLRTDPRTGSTDANIPLSLNIPAIAIGTGGTGGGIHTLQEWYDPTGRETALRRILLTLLDLAQTQQVQP